NHKKPIAPTAINVLCHPHCRAIQGTVNGARIAPTVAPELNIPVAKDLSFFGKYSAVALIAAGKFPASPIPKSAREIVKPTTETDKPDKPITPKIVTAPSPIGIATA